LCDLPEGLRRLRTACGQVLDAEALEELQAIAGS
jgi:hypothetical protein